MENGHQPHFETFKDRTGEYRWRCQARNGAFTGHSDQGFDDEGDATRAIFDHVHNVLEAAGLDSDQLAEADISIDHTTA